MRLLIIKKILPLLAIVPTLLFAQTAWDGTADSTWYTSNKSATTYTITTAEQLAGLAALVNDGTTKFEGKTIKLGADIVLNDTNASGGWRNWDSTTTGLKQWTSIGLSVNNTRNCFAGDFDGNGKIVSGLYISTTSNFQGLFGYIGGIGSSISNLGLAGFYVKGSWEVGGIAGSCYCWGSNGITTIINSYAFGNVSGLEEYGGISGYSGIVSNSYFVGTVNRNSTSNSTSNSIGAQNGRITNSFINSDFGRSGSGTPKTTAEMKQKDAYKDWDFGNVWGIGYPKDNPLNDGYPYHQQRTPLGQAQIGQISSDTTWTGDSIKPTPTVTTLDGIPKVAGVDFNYEYGENTNAGTGKVTIVGIGVFWGEREYTFKIKKAQITYPILSTFAYDGTSKTVSADSASANYITISGDITKTDVGDYNVTIALKDTANSEWLDGYTYTIPSYWTITKGPSTDCKVTMSDFTASGTPSSPVPSSPNGTYSTSQVTYSYKNQTNTNDPETATVPANVGVYKVTATFPENANYLACTASAVFTVTEGDCTPKNIQVSWTLDSVFTYNKMVQAPVPSVDEPGVELLRSNAHSAAGVYKGQDAAYAIIKDDAQRCNYALTNNTKDYEIKKKNLKTYFEAPAALLNIESNTDTLWVPHTIFADSTLLRQILDNLISYEGFAQDTVTKEKDDASVLKNTPAISVIYATPQPAQKMLAKRVETTQTAVAIINTDNVSADNYALARRSVTIMEILDDDEGSKRVLCFRGNYCTELDEEVCTFIKGEAVANCGSIRRSCQIAGTCIDNMPVSECSLIGGTVLAVSCDEYALPVKLPTLASTAFRVWQTASGIVNVDLGYMPTSPVAVQIYDLKGKLITTGEASTRFATIRLNAGGGIYIFKAGSRNTIKALK